MLWHNYLYENVIFTNKQDAALFGKGTLEKIDQKFDQNL